MSNKPTIIPPLEPVDEPPLENLEITLEGEALAQIKEVASKLNIPESKLEEVVNKALKLIILSVNSSDSKTIVIDTDKEKLEIDLKDL